MHRMHKHTHDYITYALGICMLASEWVHACVRGRTHAHNKSVELCKCSMGHLAPDVPAPGGPCISRAHACASTLIHEWLCESMLGWLHMHEYRTCAWDARLHARTHAFQSQSSIPSFNPINTICPQSVTSGSGGAISTPTHGGGAPLQRPRTERVRVTGRVVLNPGLQS